MGLERSAVRGRLTRAQENVGKESNTESSFTALEVVGGGSTRSVYLQILM